MKVGMLWEWDNPTDEERNKKRLEKSKEVNECFYKIAKERDKAKYSVWVDGTGHVMFWGEYENLDEVYKMMEDEQYQRLFAELGMYVDNFNIRWLRPMIPGVDD